MVVVPPIFISLSLLLLLVSTSAAASCAKAGATGGSDLEDTVELLQTSVKVASAKHDSDSKSGEMEQAEERMHKVNDGEDKCEKFNYEEQSGSYSVMESKQGKSWQVTSATYQASPKTKVTLVSGWLVAQWLVDFVAPQRLLDACWEFLVWLLAPWRLYLAGLAGWVAFGWLDGAKYGGCPPRMMPENKQCKGGGTRYRQDKEMLVMKMKNLRATYHPSCAFSRWVVETYAQEHFDEFEENASQSAIFYDDGDSKEDVLALATQREPVNITMRTGYKKSLLKRFFGWSNGKYGEFAADNPGALPPNIAIMCPTPIVPGLPGPESQVEQMDGMSVFVLNVISPAFHCNKEPDHAYFISGYSIKKDKKIELRQCFGRIFDKIFAAAIEYKRSSIIMPKFGATESARKFPGHLFNTIWMPAFQNALEVWGPKLKENNVVELSLMGGDKSQDFSHLVMFMGFKTKVYGDFPALLYQDSGKDRRHHAKWCADAMFVNDWDPWSFIGNGNFSDDTMGGHIGRTTALAVLGWPVTNPYLKSNMNAVVRPQIESK